jgi:hypothetical protein
MRYFLLVVVLFTLSFLARGQEPSEVVVSVGKESIRLPTPTGYINAWENYPNLRTSFEINETEGNQMLAMYAPLESIPGLDSGKYLGFPRYSRVSVSKRIADTDFSDAQFVQFVDSFEKSVKTMFNPANPGTKKVVEDVREALRNYLKTDVSSFDLKNPTYLGTVARNKIAFTCASIMSVAAFGKNIPIYNTTTVLLVKRRVLFVYFYAKLESEGDLEAFNAGAQKTADAIIAANTVKELQLRKSH